MNEPPVSPAIDAAVPAPNRGDPAAQASRRHAEHAGRTSRRKRSQRLMLAIALGVALLLLLLVSIFTSARIEHLSSENSQLNAELFQARQQLAKTVPELQVARRELADVTKGRLPHLRELVPDKVIKLDAGYVKNIVFTVLRQSGQTRYEYRVVLENAGDGLLRPDVRVLAFDQRGIQVGMGEITDRSDLIPGESRSYSSVIERFMDEEPRYFYVWVRGNKADRK